MRGKDMRDKRKDTAGPVLIESLKCCSSLLTEFIKDQHRGVFFKEPVDPIALDIPDYPNIITEPMDFSTMQKKLSEWQYPTLESFIVDMHLVFDNAVRYNSDPHNVVHKSALSLKAKFDMRIKGLKEAEEEMSLAILHQEKLILATITDPLSESAAVDSTMDIVESSEMTE